MHLNDIEKLIILSWSTCWCASYSRRLVVIVNNDAEERRRTASSSSGAPLADRLVSFIPFATS